jgi:hypothetical protein
MAEGRRLLVDGQARVEEDGKARHEAWDADGMPVATDRADVRAPYPLDPGRGIAID